MAKMPLIKEWIAKDEKEIQAAVAGQTLLIDSEAAIVKYKRQKWSVGKLLQYLADRVKELEKKQCVPTAKCIFKGQDYLDIKYSPGLPKRSKYPKKQEKEILPVDFPTDY